MTRPEGSGPCEVCGVTTGSMAWKDQFMCDGCQDDMAEHFYSDRDKVAAYIRQARESLEEAYSDRRAEQWRQP